MIFAASQGAAIFCADIGYNTYGVYYMEADFEKSFSSFLDRHEYDEAEQKLFAVVRAAYRAGWEAAGGKSPESQGILRLIKKTDGK